MFDLFDSLTYTDIFLDIEEVKQEVANLDDDSLVDELRAIQYYIDGKEAERIERIVFKNHADVDLTDDDRDFLTNVYVLHHSKYAMLVDEEEDDVFDE
jgi:hypothetical protein